jgi:lipopolysaccharide transport system permease protein
LGSDIIASELRPGSPDVEEDNVDGWHVIEPSSGWVPLNLSVLWKYRELVYFMTWRDVKIRYKQTALGAAWAVLQPLITMLIFTVIFGRFAKFPSEGVPYAIFAYCGLLPWTYFAYAMTQTTNSVVTNASLVSKVFFPRLVIPLSASLSGLVDLAVAFPLLVGMMVYFHIKPTLALLTLPVFVLLALVTVLAIGTWLSALNVQYRDVRYAVPFLTQIWLYLTPIAYPASMISGRFHVLLAFNPMTGVVEGFRWAILGTNHLDVFSFVVSTTVTLVAFVGGLYYFRRMEQRFADIV